MNISNRVDSHPVPQRVLASGNATSLELRQQACHRCGKVWWPRRPNKPARCPGCKSPYWDRPRRLKHPIMPVKEPVNQMALTKSIGRKMARTLGKGSEHGKDTDDRSLATGTSRAQGDEGSRKDLAGDGSTHGTGIRREPGEGSTESARAINTQFPAPHHLRGRDQSESQGGAPRSGRAWKVAGRLARCSVAPRCHHRDAGCRRERRRGSGGVVRLPLLS